MKAPPMSYKEMQHVVGCLYPRTTAGQGRSDARVKGQSSVAVLGSVLSPALMSWSPLWCNVFCFFAWEQYWQSKSSERDDGMEWKQPSEWRCVVQWSPWLRGCWSQAAFLTYREVAFKSFFRYGQTKCTLAPISFQCTTLLPDNYTYCTWPDTFTRQFKAYSFLSVGQTRSCPTFQSDSTSSWGSPIISLFVSVWDSNAVSCMTCFLSNQSKKKIQSACSLRSPKFNPSSRLRKQMCWEMTI